MFIPLFSYEFSNLLT